MTQTPSASARPPALHRRAKAYLFMRRKTLCYWNLLSAETVGNGDGQTANNEVCVTFS